MVCRTSFYKALIKQGILTLDKFNEFLNENKIDKDLSLFLLEGLKYYITYEFIASFFILIPQLETLVKKVAERSSISVIENVSEGLQEKTLGDFLLDEKFKKIVGDDLATYLFWFLADKTGFNLRNKVAHGLIKYLDVQNHILVGILDVIFILINIITLI